MGNITEYVEASVTRVASAQQQLQFLASTSGGATVLGNLRWHSYGNGPGRPLAGVRILVSSGAQVVESTTREDGSFAASGIQTGRVEIKVLLAEDMTLIDQPRELVIREGGCEQVHLTAGLNGRVRGRIFSSAGVALDAVRLSLGGVDANGIPIPHTPQVGTVADANGMFAFSGVPPGRWFLRAFVERVDGGNRRLVTTYFPGTAAPGAAVPIVVGKGTQHDEFDFVVAAE